MEVTPDDPTVATGSTEAAKRQLAREMADEFLGRGATIARASIKPLGIAGRLALIGGLVVWGAGPAPFWDNPPDIIFSLIALAFFAFPGVRLLRHRARMHEVLENLRTLLDNLTAALAVTTGDLSGVRDSWRKSGKTAKPGLFGTGKRCLDFYRNDIAPLREGPGKVVEQVTDLLAAFSAPALFLSGIALLLAIILIALSPIAVLVRLIILVS